MSVPHLIWFKRDLRLQDHPALQAASKEAASIFCFYVFEPSLLEDPHYETRHFRFIVQSLEDLSQRLGAFGHKLWVFWTEIEPLLQAFKQDFGQFRLFSHEEIGLAKSFQRDLQVKQWCQQQGILWLEFPQFAVQRGTQGRFGWRRFADHFFAQPLAQVDLSQLRPTPLVPEAQAQNYLCRALPKSWLQKPASFQAGGETAAWQRVDQFFRHHLCHYAHHISQPEASLQSCSRLSPYLAWGNLSLRQLLKQLNQQARSYHRSALESRLRWHCHFVQKFESDCRMEFEPLNPAFIPLLAQARAERIRSEAADFQAWSQGQTGYPLVDACMRALLDTGYLNFRMRALLVSVACHHLQLDWKAVAEHLARCFLDFEPGIHYPQIQMQAGLTGFNTLRIYNPLQQSLKQDAQAHFIQRYLPELKELPLPLQHQPWLITPLEALMYKSHNSTGCSKTYPEFYPQRCFDHLLTGKAARERLWQWKSLPQVKAYLPQLLHNQVSQDD